MEGFRDYDTWKTTEPEQEIVCSSCRTVTDENELLRCLKCDAGICQACATNVGKGVVCDTCLPKWIDDWYNANMTPLWDQIDEWAEKGRGGLVADGLREIAARCDALADLMRPTAHGVSELEQVADLLGHVRNDLELKSVQLGERIAMIEKHRRGAVQRFGKRME